jgi:hypothetical protein
VTYSFPTRRSSDYACTINNNQFGASFTGKSARGDIRLTDLALNGSAAYGLSAVRCQGTVVGGSNFSRGGDWGAYINDSSLTLSSATISGSADGIKSTLSELTLQYMRLTGNATGIHSDADQNLVMQSSVIDNSSAWALRRIDGSSQLTNCVVANNENGFYFESPAQANVWNVTVVGSEQYGVHVNAGLVSLRNTIVVGAGQGVGVHRAAGLLNMSHNLVFGFATNFSGVAPDENTVVKNPRFANAAGGDYRLSKGSPAINAGVDLLGYVDQDFLGQARPAYRRWEIGAYEYTTDDASLRVLQWNEKR